MTVGSIFRNVIASALLTNALFVAAIMPLEARHYNKHHASMANNTPVRSYQDYVGYGSNYAAIPHDPLVPLRQETPPPVDPNEATSGSYGAMVNGYNAAGTGY